MVVDLDGSPHDMTSRATIATSPALAADLLKLLTAALSHASE